MAGGDTTQPLGGWARVDNLVPMAHVADVERSMAFYALLGFTPVNTMSWDGRLGWAFLTSGSGQIMLNVTDLLPEPSAQAVLFYCYTADLPRLREHLLEQGVAVSPIRYPDYMPKGEFRLADPDGYVILVGQLESSS